MVVEVSYLRRSKDGWFSYRRRVPHTLRSFFPATATGGEMTEWKRAFRTKDQAQALKLYAIEDARFEEFKKRALAALEGIKEGLPPRLALQRAKDLLSASAALPDDAPTPPKNGTPEEWEQFKHDYQLWEEYVSDLRFHNDQELIDQLALDRDYKSGRFAQAGYTVPYTLPQTNSVEGFTRQILDGDLSPAVVPTWEDAIENYIAVRSAKQRDPVIRARKEREIRAFLEKFGAGQEADGKLLLANLDRSRIRQWLTSTYPNTSTRNRNIKTLSAVVNTWNRENAAREIYNPFNRLTDMAAEREQQERRSFTPDEFAIFLDAILHHKNQDARMVALIMAYTGCRTSEAAGLLVSDVKLEAETPYIFFRCNRVRRMDKGGLQRVVPIVEPLLSELKAYPSPTDKNAPLVRRYGHAKGFKNVAQALRSCLREQAKITDATVVPYSLRHTLVDRFRAAEVRLDHAEYILGHISAGSSRIHADYGTTRRPETLVEPLKAAFALETWGHYD